MTTIDQRWKRRAAAKVARLSPEQAREMLARIAAEGYTILHPDIRELTGGYNSQSINGHVTRLLGRRAGYVK